MLIYQSSSGYCYNSDSIFLAHFISSFEPKGKLLDVGCGVGVLGLILSRFKINISVIDKQKYMCEYANHNYSLNNIDVKVYNEDFLDYKSEHKYDIVVSNPPFYGENSMYSEDEKLSTARYAANLPIDDFINKVHRILAPKGWFYFCYDSKYITQILIALDKNHLNAEFVRFVHSKIDRESKLVLIAARHNSKAINRIMSPLIVFDEKSEYTAEAKGAFINASLHSIKGEMHGI